MALCKQLFNGHFLRRLSKSDRIFLSFLAIENHVIHISFFLWLCIRELKNIINQVLNESIREELLTVNQHLTVLEKC